MVEEIRKQLSEYEIRTVTTQNFSQVYEVYDSNQDFFLLTQGRETTIDESVNDITALPPDCDISQKVYIGIWEKGKVIGVLDLIERFPDKNTFWIGLLLIHGSLHGKKIGSGIANSVIDAAKKFGFKSAELGVIESNSKGLSFWEKLGFNVSRQAGDIIVMTRTV